MASIANSPRCAVQHSSEILNVAQLRQARVLADNADFFLKEGSWILLAIKAPSVNVAKKPSEVYEREINVLRARGFRKRMSFT